MSDTVDMSAIDMDVIEALRELGDDELLKELVDLFVTDTPPRLSELDTAFNAGDADTVASVAHSLKSSSANLGALRLSDLCRELEAAGRAAALDAAENLVVLSQEEYERVSQALKACVS